MNKSVWKRARRNYNGVCQKMLSKASFYPYYPSTFNKEPFYRSLLYVYIFLGLQCLSHIGLICLSVCLDSGCLNCGAFSCVKTSELNRCCICGLSHLTA